MTRSVAQPSPPAAGPVAGIPPQDLRQARVRLERVSVFLDSGIRVPGTGWRIGWESLIGLIPGIGDLAGLLCGAWLMVEAWRLSAPSTLLLRMGGNLALDAVAGLVPLAGDLLDFAFKSNRRNARLLSGHLDRLEGRPPASRSAGLLTLLLVLAVLALAFVGVWALLGMLLR